MIFKIIHHQTNQRINIKDLYTYFYSQSTQYDNPSLGKVYKVLIYGYLLYFHYFHAYIQKLVYYCYIKKFQKLHLLQQMNHLLKIVAIYA